MIAEDTKKIISDNREMLERDGAAAITNKLTEGVTTGISKITEGLASINITQIANYLTSQEEESDIALRLKKLQQDPNTFNSEPEDAEFIEWKQTFDWNIKKDETQHILATNKEIFNTYSQLVPKLLSPQEFWERYYYRIKVLNDEEEKRAALLKRAAEQAPSVTDLTWDEFDVDEKQSNEVLNETPNKTPKTMNEPTNESNSVTKTNTDTTTTEDVVLPPKPEVETDLHPNKEQLEKDPEKPKQDNEPKEQQHGKEPVIAHTANTVMEQNQNRQTKLSGKKDGDDWLDWGEEPH